MCIYPCPVYIVHEDTQPASQPNRKRFIPFQWTPCPRPSGQNKDPSYLCILMPVLELAICSCFFLLGWLMVVQLFVTLTIILSLTHQIVLVALLLRYPLEIILRFEHHFCNFACASNAVSGKNYIKVIQYAKS